MCGSGVECFWVLSQCVVEVSCVSGFCSGVPARQELIIIPATFVPDMSRGRGCWLAGDETEAGDESRDEVEVGWSLGWRKDGGW